MGWASWRGSRFSVKEPWVCPSLWAAWGHSGPRTSPGPGTRGCLTIPTEMSRSVHFSWGVLEMNDTPVWARAHWAKWTPLAVPALGWESGNSMEKGLGGLLQSVRLRCPVLRRGHPGQPSSPSFAQILPCKQQAPHDLSAGLCLLPRGSAPQTPLGPVGGVGCWLPEDGWKHSGAHTACAQSCLLSPGPSSIAQLPKCPGGSGSSAEVRASLLDGPLLHHHLSLASVASWFFDCRASGRLVAECLCLEPGP